MREGVASALNARAMIEDARVLDLYAGTGALAFEVLSRGAASAVLVEKRRRVARAIERSAQELGLSDRVVVVETDLERRDGSRWLDAIDAPVDLVLIDPPYAQIAQVEVILSTLAGESKLDRGAAVVIEHARRGPPTLPVGFSEVSRYRYGDTAVLLAKFTPNEESQP